MLIQTGIAVTLLLLSTCLGCQPGKFGSNCLQECSTHCSGNGSCNQTTGDCDNGCKDGWTGSKCGIQQNTDGSSSYVVTIGAVSCTFGGVAITSAAAMVCAMFKKKVCFGKKNRNPPPQPSQDTTINIEKAVIIYGGGLDKLTRDAIAGLSTNEPLAINAI